MKLLMLLKNLQLNFQVQWWEALKGIGANAGGEDIN